MSVGEKMGFVDTKALEQQLAQNELMDMDMLGSYTMKAGQSQLWAAGRHQSEMQDSGSVGYRLPTKQTPKAFAGSHPMSS